MDGVAVFKCFNWSMAGQTGLLEMGIIWSNDNFLLADSRGGDFVTAVLVVFALFFTRSFKIASKCLKVMQLKRSDTLHNMFRIINT